MVETAPLNQTIKIQLNDWAGVRPSWPATEMWSSPVPKAYQTKVVNPAQIEAVLKSPKYESLPVWSVSGEFICLPSWVKSEPAPQPFSC